MPTIRNQATLTYTGGAVTSNVTVGELIDTLAINKTVTNNTYRTGDELTYVINLVNSGNTLQDNLTVTDDLGAYTAGVPATTVYPLTYTPDSLLYFVNGVLQATLTVTAGPPLTVSGISVPAGGNASIIYRATTNEYAPLNVGNTVNNTASVTGPGRAEPAEAVATATAVAGPNLEILKTMSPTTVTENGQLTYTFTIQNFGNTPATTTDNVAVTDNFDPILNNIAVTYNGTPWATPANYTYNPGNGAFATVPGLITVPAATYETDPTTGAVTTTPGTATLVVSGTV